MRFINKGAEFFRFGSGKNNIMVLQLSILVYFRFFQITVLKYILVWVLDHNEAYSPYKSN